MPNNQCKSGMGNKKPACACPNVESPVCCKEKNGKRSTQPNACTCRCGGKGQVEKRGACEKDMMKEEEEEEEGCFCPAVFKPVCCKKKNGMKMTEGNSCECGCAKGVVESEGECPSKMMKEEEEEEEEGCFCAAVFKPVCCQLKNGTKKTESNSCTCSCNKGRVLSSSSC